MKTYAEGTSVPIERSFSAITKLLVDAGARQCGTMNDDDAGRAYVLFTLEGRKYQVEVPLPKREAFGRTGDRYARACRERWRLVHLIIKTKLHVIALKASTPEREFLADAVTPSGKTVMQLIAGAPSNSALALLPEAR